MEWKAAGGVGAVAAGGQEAVAAGISVLGQGGNAADAAVATILALSITDYGLFAIGGEVPFMIYDAPKGEVKILSGLGRAPQDPSAMEWFYEHGIPSKGDVKATPVPGAVGLCMTALRLYGTVSFAKAVGPSLALLDAGGEVWHGPLATTFRRLIEAEDGARGGREERLKAAEDRFYRGDIADALEAFYARSGGFLTKADLAVHQTRLEDPVSVTYRGWRVFKCGPWTQGPYLCQALQLLEGFDLGRMRHLSSDYVHVIVEALKLALADRDEFYGDPLFADVPLRALFSDEYTEMRRALIDMSRASAEIRPGDPLNMRPIKSPGAPQPAPGGTTTCVVADRWGNVVAATPSCNPPYAICEEVGIAHGNRLRSLNTTPGHPNSIEPGKRPRITLTPTLAVNDDGRVMAISVAGGDLQDQTTLNCFLNHVEFGMSPAEAVTAPRFSTSHHQDSFNPDPRRDRALAGARLLKVGEGIGESARHGLAGRGHKLEVAAGALGCPVMLLLNPASRVVEAAGDPRTGRHADAL